MITLLCDPSEDVSIDIIQSILLYTNHKVQEIMIDCY
jgi:hypothetical protein